MPEEAATNERRVTWRGLFLALLAGDHGQPIKGSGPPIARRETESEERTEGVCHDKPFVKRPPQMSTKRGPNATRLWKEGIFGILEPMSAMRNLQAMNSLPRPSDLSPQESGPI